MDYLKDGNRVGGTPLFRGRSGAEGVWRLYRGIVENTFIARGNIGHVQRGRSVDAD